MGAGEECMYNQLQSSIGELNKQYKKEGIMIEERLRITAWVLLAYKHGDIQNIDETVDEYLRGNVSSQDYLYIKEYVYTKTEYSGVIIKLIGNLTVYVDSGYDVLNELYKGKDGKNLGIVLTPGYVSEFMAELVGVTDGDTVVDTCAGTGSLVLGARRVANVGLVSVELNKTLYTLNKINSLLQVGVDWVSYNGDSIHKDLSGKGINKALLNPPYSYEENGMPFVVKILDDMVHEGLLAVIIQDSAGTGQAVKTNKQILTRHTLKAIIKMPADLFQPNAGVQTSIYIFEAHKPHDYRNTVRFIDFSDDGYKRTGRGTRKTGDPDKRYQNVLEVYKYGANSGVTDIEFIDACITDSGDDWNFNQHRVIDTTPTEEDFMKTVGDYIQFELSQIISGRKTIEELQAKKVTPPTDVQEPSGYKKFRVGDLFRVTGTKSTNAGTLEFKDCGVEFIGRTSVNNGVQGYIDELEYAPNEEGTITVSQVGTIVAQYRGASYYTSQNIAKLEYNRKLSKEEGLYFVTHINKHLQLYGGYQTPKLDDIKNIILELPVLAPNSKQIDWNAIRHVVVKKKSTIWLLVWRYTTEILR